MLKSKPAFYTTRLSDGRKVELSEEEYYRHLNAAMANLNARKSKIGWKAVAGWKPDNLVRSHLELGGHLEGK